MINLGEGKRLICHIGGSCPVPTPLAQTRKESPLGGLFVMFSILDSCCNCLEKEYRNKNFITSTIFTTIVYRLVANCRAANIWLLKCVRFTISVISIQ